MTTQAASTTGADGHGAGLDTRGSDADELELFRVLTRVMSEGSDTESSLRGALETICSRTQWSYGELWLRHAQTGAFHLSLVWHGAGTPAEMERYRVFHEASWLRGVHSRERGPSRPGAGDSPGRLGLLGRRPAGPWCRGARRRT
jgi:hypothetical protein